MVQLTEPSHLTLVSLLLAGLGALVIAPMGALTDRERFWIGAPLAVGVVALAEFDGVAAVLGVAALLLSFVLGVGARVRVVRLRRSARLDPSGES